MKSINTLCTFSDVIAGSTPASRKLAMTIRRLISDVCPGVVEVPWPKLRVVGYGIGPKKSTEHFCYIAPFSTHVNLGLTHGLNLPDPAALLQGTGKAFRHVKIVKTGDLKNPALKALLRSAVLERENAVRKKG